MRAACRTMARLVLIAMACGEPPTAVAQEGACAVQPAGTAGGGWELRRLEVRIVSAGGGEIEGARIDLKAQAGGGVADRGRSSAEGRCVVRVPSGSRVLLHVTAAGHRARQVWLSGERGARESVRIVLPLDPYRLPDLAARVPGLSSSVAGRAVQEIRFGERPIPIGSLAEWLRSKPAVSIRGRGAGGEQVVSVRGSRPEGVLVLLDGMPINGAMTGRADVSTIPVATLESAVLLPGTGSAAYGSGAGAGVLLLTSRTARGGVGGATVSLGSFGARRLVAHGTIDGPVGRFSAAAHLAEAENDYPFRNRLVPDAPWERRSNADVHSTSVSLAATTEWVASALRVDWLERGAPGRMGSSLFDEARWEDAGWTASLASGGPGRRWSAAFRSRSLEYRPGPATEPERDRASELRFGVEQRLDPGLPLELRLRGSREWVSGDRLQEPRARTVVGVFAGVWTRVGWVRLRPAASVDVTAGVVAPSPELSVEIGDAASLRGWARVGRGFRLPTFADLYFTSSQGIRPNPDLEAERVTLDAEAGAGGRGELREVLAEWSVSAHYRRTQDPIVWLASAASVWSPNNLGHLRAWGLELEGALSRSRDRRMGWRFEFAATLERSRLGFGSNGNPMPYQPEVRGHAALEAWTPRFAGRAAVRHTGSRTTSVAATRRLPAFTLVDVSLSWRPAGGSAPLQVTVGVENAFDVRYELTELFPEPGRTVALRLGTN